RNLGGWRDQVHALRASLPQPRPPRALAMLPDGDRVVLGGDYTVWCVNLATGQCDKEALVLDKDKSLLTLAVVPGSDTILLAVGEEVLRTTTRLWKPVAHFTRHQAPLVALAVSADGKLAASIDDAGVVWLWDAASGAERWSLPVKSAARCCAFSPCGHFLLTGGADRVVRRWDLDAQRELPVAASVDGPIDALVSNPDGQSFLVATSTSTPPSGRA